MKQSSKAVAAMILDSGRPRFYRLDTLGDRDNPERCVLHNFIHGLLNETWRVHSGEPMAHLWPHDALIHMREDDRSPKIGSIVSNVWDMLLVSRDLCEVIKDRCVGVPVEYLPIRILDPRGRELASDYTLVNPLGTFDCIDYQKSEITYKKRDPSKVLQVDRMVLARAKIETAPQLFRPKDAKEEYVVGAAILRAWHELGATNVVATPIPSPE